MIAILASNKARLSFWRRRLQFATKKGFPCLLARVMRKSIKTLRRQTPAKKISPRLRRRKLVKARVNNAKLARNIGFRFRGGKVCW